MDYSYIVYISEWWWVISHYETWKKEEKGPGKIHLRKKRVESKLRRKYVLNLLNEPQNLAEIKTPKLLKILNQKITNLRQRKLKHNLLKLREDK